MKAWTVKAKDEVYTAVVFAETRGKARVLARYTDACEDADFCDIEVRRAPSIDKYYKEGKTEMSWDNSEDRVALVKELGFCCEEVDLCVCEYCPAKQFCDRYKDELKDTEESND